MLCFTYFTYTLNFFIINNNKKYPAALCAGYALGDVRGDVLMFVTNRYTNFPWRGL